MTLSVLVTRPETISQNKAGFGALLVERGFNPLSYPVLEYQIISDDLVREAIQRDYSWHVFSSPASVTVFAKLAAEFDFTPKFQHVAVQGFGTARTFRDEFQIEPDLAPSEFTSEALAQRLKKVVSSTDTVLVAGSEGSRDIVYDTMQELRVSVKKVSTYRMQPKKQLPMIAAPDHLVVTFFSPSAVKAFTRNAPSDLLKVAESSTIVAVGPITARAAREAGFRNLVESKEHSEEGVLNALMELKNNG